jgi:hypothetical protein
MTKIPNFLFPWEGCFGDWNLDIGDYLEFEIWLLGFM